MKPEDLPVEGAEMRHSYVDAAGLRMHVAEAGPADGDPVVMVHGWPQHWWIWRGLIPHFTQAGYRVICLDLRGHGWSDAPPSGYEKEQFASDLLAAADALGLERFRLMGHDWGGFASFLAALRAPERVERLVALAIVHPWIEREGGLAAQLNALAGASYQLVLSAPYVGPALVQRLPLIDTLIKIGSGGRVPAEARERYVERFRDGARARATAAIYRAFLTRELQPILKGRYRGVRLKVPTLLLFGDSDRVVTERRLAGWEPHADDMRVEGVANAGHFLPDERPDEVARRALDFFAG